MRRFPRCAWALVLVATSCGGSPPEPSRLGAHSFAFGVFGDGPYRSWEEARFRRVLEDANRADLEWFLHVGDILWFPCSDAALTKRLDVLNTIGHPVIYTPGDNEWADCYEPVAGTFMPLDRLRFIRSTFFSDPGSSLGARKMRVESQSADPDWPEFVENVRWTLGGFLFVTVHMVGSDNASLNFPGRTAADTDEVARRTAAALDWLDDAFSIAGRDSLSGIFVAFHADPAFEDAPAFRPGYGPFMDRLEKRAHAFPGSVVVIHGDSHEFRVDHPFRDEAGETLDRFTRLETFGSPDIGWVRVVVDSVAGEVVAYEPRLMPRRFFFW